MARNMDAFADQILEFQLARAELSKMEKQARLKREETDKLQAKLINTMQNSVEATLNGRPVFVVEPTSRRSVKVETVMKLHPELEDELIETKLGKKIKFL